MKKTHKTRYTKQKMLAYYKEWQESGLGKKAYCSKKGLTPSTFFYWIRKLALQNQSFSPASPIGFTELTLPAQQVQSGLGLEAQKASVASYVKDQNRIIAEYTEVESGKNNTREQLLSAIAYAKRNLAKLIIAKLDRLSRNAGLALIRKQVKR